MYLDVNHVCKPYNKYTLSLSLGKVIIVPIYKPITNCELQFINYLEFNFLTIGK